MESRIYLALEIEHADTTRGTDKERATPFAHSDRRQRVVPSDHYAAKACADVGLQHGGRLLLELVLHHEEPGEEEVLLEVGPWSRHELFVEGGRIATLLGGPRPHGTGEHTEALDREFAQCSVKVHRDCRGKTNILRFGNILSNFLFAF